MALKDKLYVASALDPRFKARPFLSDDTCDETFSRLMAGGEQVEAEASNVSYKYRNINN